MNDLLDLIQKKYGALCQFCPPLEEAQYQTAQAMLPADLFELLKISNGVLELMTHPKANDGKPFVIGNILYSFEDMCIESGFFAEQFGKEGLAIAGNGAGGYFIMNPDGTIDLYEYIGEAGERYAENLRAFIAKC
ncbi:MAG: hypothetical protein IK134_09655 [Oscillospiraceae bacterium]|nr:hypothetical protein [Oscillospiraceae bacterium]